MEYREKRIDGSIYSLSDDMVKLVAYTIVSVRRDAERVVPGGEGTIVVTDNVSGSAFVSWLIAKYLQQRAVTDDGEEKNQGELLPMEDRKYLRVYYVVSWRWPREPLKFEERQTAVLEDVRDSISERSSDSSPRSM